MPVQVKQVKTENVTDPIKATTQTSYFRIFLASITVGPLMVLGYTWLANVVLPPEDATAFKTPLLALWGLIGSGSGTAVIIGALKRTFGKVEHQLNQAQSVNAEGPAPLVASGGNDLLGSLLQGVMPAEPEVKNPSE